jgi:hypothetical protein
MTEAPAANDEDAENAIIYLGYGKVMHQLQALELTLWQVLATKFKPGMTDGQMLAKLEKWDGTTLGQLVRGLKTQPHWPPALVDKLLAAVEHRNYLAHHFLREYFVVEHSQHNRDAASQALVEESIWLEKLDDELAAHLATLGIGTGSVEDLDDETRAEIDALRPTDWAAFVYGTDSTDGE